MGPSTRPELMEWTDEPATWKQLKYLRQLGCKLDHPLTKIEASDLIGKLGGRQERCIRSLLVAHARTSRAPGKLSRTISRAASRLIWKAWCSRV